MSAIRPVMSRVPVWVAYTSTRRPCQPFRRHQVNESLFLGIDLLLGQGRDLDDELAAGRVEDRLSVGAAVGIGQAAFAGRLPSSRLEPFLSAADQGLVQFLEDVVVGAYAGRSR